MQRFTTTVGDTLPAIEATLLDQDGVTVVPLAPGDTVAFRMRRPGASVRAIDDAPAVVVDGPAGRVRYDWQPGDVLEDGEFDNWWVVSWAGGGQTTFPRPGHDRVLIEEAG